MLRCMSPTKKRAVDDAPSSEQAMRDQEVLRANRELAAYFKGRRTEREARAALKIIKAFVRDRERHGPKNRPPLPGRAPTRDDSGAPQKTSRQRARRPKPRHKDSPATAVVEPAAPQSGAERDVD